VQRRARLQAEQRRQPVTCRDAQGEYSDNCFTSSYWLRGSSASGTGKALA